MKRMTITTAVAVALGVSVLSAITPVFQTQAYAQATIVYSDLWWNPTESGWGINLNHQNDIIFATWFTYGANNANAWYVMSDLRRQADGSFTGTIFQTTGVPFNQINGATSTRSVNNVGNATLRFSAASAGTFSYTVNGVSQTKNIVRQPLIQTPTTCTQQAASGSRAASQNYQDLWYIPAESGWGVNLTHQGDILFATWFTYNAAGTGQWLVASNVARQADGSYTGRLFRTTGTAFNLINGTPSLNTAPDVGSITFRFSNGEAGVMTYTLDGVAGTKNIVRQVFGTTVNSCTNQASTVTTTPPPPPPGPPVSGSCVSLDLTAGNTKIFRSTTPGIASSETQEKMIGAGTFQGKTTMIMESRGLINGVPDPVNYAYLHYEDRGSTAGVIAGESFSATGKVTTTYDPVDYQPKVVSVGQTASGTYTANTIGTQSGFGTLAKTIYSYTSRVTGTETVTVPAGTFVNACKAEATNVSTRSSFAITGLPAGIPGIGGFDYTCTIPSTTSLVSAIGNVKYNGVTGTCTGSFAQGVPIPNIPTTVTELVRATVNGRTYP